MVTNNCNTIVNIVTSGTKTMGYHCLVIFVYFLSWSEAAQHANKKNDASPSIRLNVH